MNKYLFSLTFLVASLFLFASCTKEKDTTPDPTPQQPAHLKLGHAYTQGMRAELYADTLVRTGYNKLYVALFDSLSGNRITAAQVSILPMMHMGSMSHGAPSESPTSMTAIDQFFPGAAVFTMPGDSTEWSVELTIMKDGQSATASIPVNVAQAAPERVRSFISGVDGKAYIVALVEPARPIVGVNDLELVVFATQSMMSFPADSTMTIINEPEMPSMGHGSPNNVDPVHTGRGHYKGKVNFTMTGLWRLNMIFKSGSAIADSTTSFDVSF